MEEKKELQTITIELKSGPIIAAHEGDIIVAQGLKHSEQQRFKRPTAVQPWTEPIDCTKPGPLCPHLPFEFEPLGDMMKLDRPASEDCLTANVVFPSSALNEGATPLPVLVWIHGGAYIAGTGDLSLYDTRGLARRGIVVVSIQYRMWLLGYASIPAIDAPANLGLMDQIAGLKWVQENVSSFGGDPNNVTIFGQSAGADSVYSILLASGTESLFHRAILMSSPFGLFHHPTRRPVIFGKTVKKYGDGKDLATAPLSELTRVGSEIFKGTRRWGLLVPGFYVESGAYPLPPAKDAPARLKERAAQIPIMIGWTKHDVLPFLMLVPVLLPLAHAPAIGKYPLLGLSRIFTYATFIKESKAIHRQYLKDGGKSVAFSIEWYPKSSKFRACHCMETPLLFGGYDEWVKTPILEGADREKFEKLAVETKNLVTTFVRGGSVAAENLVLREDYEFIDGEK